MGLRAELSPKDKSESDGTIAEPGFRALSGIRSSSLIFEIDSCNHVL